jgi:hypothetical protein
MNGIPDAAPVLLEDFADDFAERPADAGEAGEEDASEGLRRGERRTGDCDEVGEAEKAGEEGAGTGGAAPECCCGCGEAGGEG